MGLYTVRDACAICNSLWMTLIPYNRDFGQLGSLSFKKIFAFSWNRRFITLFAKNLPLFPILDQMRAFRAVPYYLFHIRFCIITNLQLGIQCVPFLSKFPKKNLYAFLCFLVFATWSIHLVRYLYFPRQG
jgi:hypothetical protein